MLRNYFFINLILVIIIGFLGFELYKVFAYSVDIPTELTSQKDNSVEDAETKYTEKTLKRDMFDVIAENDLFRPSRSAPLSTERKPEVAPSTTPPKLFGTIIINNDKTAILEDPETKTTRTYRINESIAGYIVSDIYEDKVVLLRDGEEIEVKLREDKGIKSSKRRSVRQPPARRTIKREPRRKPRPVPPRRSPQRTDQMGTPQDEIEELLEEME
jgi:type II secretory pathway component PulC